MPAENLLPHPPLTESTYWILLSMGPGPSHGYAIMKDVEALSSGRIVLSTGTLYGALKRLLELEWIERVDDPAQDETGRPRKAYRLTRLGRQILEAELGRLKALVKAARRRAVRGQAS
jgi:DNA-binding PadR family transcriptional regulator